MLIFPTVEPLFVANNGISDSVNNLLHFLPLHNVTAGDLVQFAGLVALSNCPVSRPARARCREFLTGVGFLGCASDRVLGWPPQRDRACHRRLDPRAAGQRDVHS